MKTMITFLMLLVCSITFSQDKIYIHTATAENSSGQITYLDHPDLNGNPDAGIVYCHNSGPTTLFNNNVTGLWYSGSQWAIYNENPSIEILEGSQYNVYIGDPANVITHVSTTANQGSFGTATTVIDNELLNGANGGPFAVFSNYWNPNGVYNNQNYGFYFDIDLNKRGIYHEQGANPIPDGAAFKILITGNDTERFTHQTNTTNTTGNATVLDHASLNNNPDATFVFSHYWGRTGIDSQLALNAVLSVWYSGTNWVIYTEDSFPLPIGVAFDIIIAEQEILSIEENSIIDASVNMYPNPANDLVTISSESIINNITLFNVLGQEIFKASCDSNILDLDISNYARGSYFVTVEMDNTTKTLKLIKN